MRARPGLSGHFLDFAPRLRFQAEGRADPVEVGCAGHRRHEFEDLGSLARRQDHREFGSALGDAREERADEAGGSEDEPGVAVGDPSQAHSGHGDVDHPHPDGRSRRNPGGLGGLFRDGRRFARRAPDLRKEFERLAQAEFFGQRFVVPRGRGDVEEGAGRLGEIRGANAGELETDPVFAVEMARRPGDGLRLCGGKLLVENREKPAENGCAGDVEHRAAAAVEVPVVDPAGSPAVHPIGCGAHGLAVGVDEPGAVALPGQPDADDPRSPHLFGDAAQAGGDRLPQQRHVLLAFAVCAVANGDGFVMGGFDLPVQVEGDGLDGRGSAVDTDDDVVH